MTTAPGLAGVLLKNDIVPIATLPGTAGAGSGAGGVFVQFTFPVTGGSVNLTKLTGTIGHGGGILFPDPVTGQGDRRQRLHHQRRPALPDRDREWQPERAGPAAEPGPGRRQDQGGQARRAFFTGVPDARMDVINAVFDGDLCAVNFITGGTGPCSTARQPASAASMRDPGPPRIQGPDRRGVGRAQLRCPPGSAGRLSSSDG